MYRLSFSSIASSDDDETHKHHHHHFFHRHQPHTTSPTSSTPTSTSPFSPQRSRQPSTSSERSCSDMSLDQTRALWLCMLELQARYGCYNSTRIEMALMAGDEAVDLMPNRFIIDVLNESIIDLPDEGRKMLDRHLLHAHAPRQAKKRTFNFLKK